MLFCCQKKTTDNSVQKLKKYADIVISEDTLYSFDKDEFEYGSSYGYLNKKGDTIIPAGTFNMCFTDTFSNFAYVYDKKLFGEETVAINRNQEVIFDVFLFDNGPDYLSDGFFRIKRNGKIGYADKTGKIVIDPQYSCAFPFENGKAKVTYNCETTKDELELSTWKSDSWFYIDKNGTKVE